MEKQNELVYLKAKDHSVSGEEFELHYDQELELLKTVPPPSPKKLPSYYKSEDYISHTDSKRNLFEWAYHLVRTFTLKRKLKLIDRFTPYEGKHLLDIGCGTGDFLFKAKKQGWQTTGIEPDFGARAIANSKIGNHVLDSSQISQLESNSYDVITLWHVLEHLPELENHFNQFYRLLKEEGLLIIAVPNFKSYDAEYYKAHWAAYDVPRHLWHFSQSSISKLANQHQFDLLKILPMKFDAYYVSMLSEKIKTGSINIFNAFKVGYSSNRAAKTHGEYSSLTYVLKKRN